MLEKAFVIKSVWGFSRNLRKEIVKKNKYYFLDNGVRNGLIGNFNSLERRNDQGQLWENWLVNERLKRQEYERIYVNNYFWRTWDGQEVDWVEEREGKLNGYEFKWGKKRPLVPRKWLETYPEADYRVIGRENWWEFVVGS